MTELADTGETSEVLSRGPNRKEQSLEIAVFLFLIIPAMALSFFIVHHASVSFTVLAADTICRDIGLTALILFFLWRNGEPFSVIGCRGKNVWKDIGLGVAIFIPVTLVIPAVEGALKKIGLTAPAAPLPALTSARGVPEMILALVMVAIVAVAEETIFRGYLILRLKTVTGSMAAAVILSSVIFSLGHGYEGSAGMATVGSLGLVLAWVYLWRKSLVAPVVIHFLQDFVGIVLLPLLKQLHLIQ